MHSMRAFFLRHRVMAIVLVIAALSMKIALPAGFMIGQGSRVLTVQVCDEATGSAAARLFAIPVHGNDGDSSGKQTKNDCPFSSLSMATVSDAGPLLLVLALSYILALGFAPVHFPQPRREFHLRPPLRGPPAFV